jgi:hypothetical protein
LLETCWDIFDTGGWMQITNFNRFIVCGKLEQRICKKRRLSKIKIKGPGIYHCSLCRPGKHWVFIFKLMTCTSKLKSYTMFTYRYVYLILNHANGILFFSYLTGYIQCHRFYREKQRNTWYQLFKSDAEQSQLAN